MRKPETFVERVVDVFDMVLTFYRLLLGRMLTAGLHGRKDLNATTSQGIERLHIGRARR